MGLNVIDKNVFFVEDHQKLLNTSKITKPWINEVPPKGKSLKVYSLFQRRRSRRGEEGGDGNPLIYALKGHKEYIVCCREMVKLKPFFDHNLSVCIKYLDFDVVVLSPSSYGIASFLFARLVKLEVDAIFYEEVFEKVTNKDAIDQIKHNILDKKSPKGRRYYTTLLSVLEKNLDLTFSMKEVIPQYRRGLLVYKFTDAFNKKILKNKKILLIDDLLATGSSLLTAQELLVGAGAKTVSALCIFSALH